MMAIESVPTYVASGLTAVMGRVDVAREVRESRQ